MYCRFRIELVVYEALYDARLAGIRIAKKDYLEFALAAHRRRRLVHIDYN